MPVGKSQLGLPLGSWGLGLPRRVKTPYILPSNVSPGSPHLTLQAQHQLRVSLGLHPTEQRARHVVMRARGANGRLTLTLRCCTRDGWHLTLLVLQQPVQRLTSTHGGQIRKLADVGSTWLRGIS